MDPSFCHVLGNCTSVVTFRVGIHLRRGNCLCRLTSGEAVFVFKDIVLWSSNSFCFKQPFWRGAAAVGQTFAYTCRERGGNGSLEFPIFLGACCATAQMNHWLKQVRTVTGRHFKAATGPKISVTSKKVPPNSSGVLKDWTRSLWTSTKSWKWPRDD